MSVQQSDADSFSLTLMYIYRVIQEESARLREMIVCVILCKKVHIKMCPILDGYGVMTVFSFPYTPSCEPHLTAGGVTYSASLSRHFPGMRGRWGGGLVFAWRAGAVHNRAAACVATGGSIFENQL